MSAAIGETDPTQPPWLVDEVLRTGRLPNYLVRILLDLFRVTDVNGEALTTKLRQGGGIHAFLWRLTAEAAPASSLVGLTLLRVYQDGEEHSIHSFFSLLIGLYDPDRQLFGCCG